MTGKLVAGQRSGYVRVSALDRNVDRRLEGVDLDRRYTDRVPGKDIKRPADPAAGSVSEGDTV